jgi:pimeloyl-ACP methyl ester carboxylesterase
LSKACTSGVATLAGRAALAYDDGMPACDSPGGGRLAWDDTGRGEPAMVLLHGWCCDRSYLAPLQTALAARHRVIAVDLPGHGVNDAPHRDYSVPALTADVAWLCDRLGLDRPVLIGHSLGGAIAVQLAVDRPARVAAAVSLDTTIGPAPETRQAWATLVDALATPNFRAAARDAIGRLYFLPTDDAARRERIIDAMTALPHHVMHDGFVGIASWDSDAAVAALRVPFLHIARSVGGTDHSHLRRICPPAFTGRVVGSGHFITLEVPDQVTAMIQRFMELI